MTKSKEGWNFMELALLAFAGLGGEALLAFLLEPMLYGRQMREWSTGQNIAHWIITCVLWGLIFFWLSGRASGEYGFDLFEKRPPLRPWQWIVSAVCLIFMFVVSYMDWNGFKVLREFQSNGWLKFVFQYIYYFFETGLFLLIIIFGQKAFEKWFGRENFPYGGIAVALTWGLGHILTKDSLAVGLLSALSGFVFGVVYLLVNRDVRKAFPLLFLMFVL